MMKTRINLFKNLRYISRCDKILPIDIQNVINYSSIRIGSQSVITYLCRESQSLTSFTREAVESLISKLIDPHKKFSSIKDIPKRHFSFTQKLTLKFIDSHISQSKVEMSGDEILKMGDILFKNFSDFL